MGIFANRKENNRKDATARANVEQMKADKRKRDGTDRMSPALADQLNKIQKLHGKRERF